MRKTAFKKSEVIWRAQADHITSNFLRLSSTNFAWFIRDYLDPFIKAFNKSSPVSFLIFKRIKAN